MPFIVNEIMGHPSHTILPAWWRQAGVNIDGSVIGYAYAPLIAGPLGVLVKNGAPQWINYPVISLMVPGTLLNAIDKWGNILGNVVGCPRCHGFVRWVKCTPAVGCGN